MRQVARERLGRLLINRTADSAYLAMVAGVAHNLYETAGLKEYNFFLGFHPELVVETDKVVKIH